MTGHRIYARHSGVETAERLSCPLIKRCVRRALSIEGVGAQCEVSVLITDDCGIRNINTAYRGIDSPTDVLSFPAQDFSPPGWADPGPRAIEPETGCVPLGEIVLSAQRVRLQAAEYGHPPEHETVYLVIHSVLHLLGYDHTDEAEGKKAMRAREKKIMLEMGYDK